MNKQPYIAESLAGLENGPNKLYETGKNTD